MTVVERTVPVAEGTVTDVSGVPACFDRGWWRWQSPVFELSTVEMRSMVRQIVTVVSARLSEQSFTSPQGLDGEKVRAATLCHETLANLQTARLRAGENPLSHACEDAIATAVMDRIFSLGELSLWWRHSEVENIAVNGHTTCIVTFAGGLKLQVGQIAENEEDLNDVLRGIARRLGLSEQGFDARNPKVDVQLPDGSRLTMVYGGDRSGGVAVVPYAAIRRHRYSTITPDDLVTLGALPAVANDFMRAAVRAGLNVIVCGTFNAGKTTALRAWAMEIPVHQRIVTVEPGITELGLHLRPDSDVAAMFSREDNAEGTGGVSVADLISGPVRRMSAARVIGGEINNGNELLPMLDSMTSSDMGSMFTVHARSARLVVDRLETYGLMADPPKDPRLVRAMVVEARPLIVHFTIDERDAGRSDRYVTAITEVVGKDGDSGTVLFNDLWRLPATGNTIEACGRPSQPACERLARYGWVWERDGWAVTL
jgi:pilus assembly protein CpaF